MYFHYMIIHKIAIYVKDAKIAKILYHDDEYRNYVQKTDEIYDELVYDYSNAHLIFENKEICDEEEFKKRMKSLIRIKDKFPYPSVLYVNWIKYAIRLNFIGVVKWLYEQNLNNEIANIERFDCTSDLVVLALEYGRCEILENMYEYNIRWRRCITAKILNMNTTEIETLKYMRNYVSKDEELSNILKTRSRNEKWYILKYREDGEED